MTRSEAREQAFILVFERIFNPEISAENITKDAIESKFFIPDNFADNLFTATIEYEEKTDEIISSFLKDWRIQRIPKIALAILRLAVTEIIYFDDIPDSVSANEAVELAKKYAGEEDASFINGVLGSVIRAKEQ